MKKNKHTKPVVDKLPINEKGYPEGENYHKTCKIQNKGREYGKYYTRK